MIHLFKKVYVTSDQVIDVNLDRYVVSSRINGNMIYGAEPLTTGVVQGVGETWQDIVPGQYKTWSAFFNALGARCEETGMRVMIYVDDEAYTELMSVWFKSILKTPSKSVIENLLKVYSFRFNAFYRGRLSGNSGIQGSATILNVKNFSSIYDASGKLTTAQRTSFLTTYGGSISVEYLLASHLGNGTYTGNLKNVISVLLRKDLEKYFYELKEILWIHLLTDWFTDTLDLKQDYTFENLTEFLNDDSKYANLLLTDRIWASPFMQTASTRGNIKFEELTPEDIQAVKDYNVLAGADWNEENGYIVQKSEVCKLDFLECITGEFTDELLQKLLETESTYAHVAGTFFSLDLETVNHYLVQSLLNNWKKGDTDYIKQFSL
jgi:hypothetical protein